MHKALIRFATKADVRRVTQLSKDAWPAWWKENPGYGIRYARDRIHNKRTLVATHDGRIVAYMVYGSVWSRHWHLEDVYVEPRYRKQHIGAMLMEKLFQLARKNGVNKILSEVEPKNKTSYKYHIDSGFKRTGYMKRLWGNTDAIVLMKELK